MPDRCCIGQIVAAIALLALNSLRFLREETAGSFFAMPENTNKTNQICPPDGGAFILPSQISDHTTEFQP
jgi:hypothetical protein